MELKLEELEYQRLAIQSVVKIFEGNEKNTFDNACIEGIRFNMCSLSAAQIQKELRNTASENGIDASNIQLSDTNDVCIEMETGTGKTLVYIKTICELYRHYGFTKFIILVPSVAIRQGVLGTFDTFGKQLADIYGFTPKSFAYDSKKLNKVAHFVQEQNLQVMVMTLASFNSEDKILNQTQREDLFSNMPFIEAIGKTKPFIIMDEPQEGMDTENSLRHIAKLNPLMKLRYSATHKVVKNLVFRLTPFDSYKEGLVKKIQVLTVTEKNDEATMKIELSEILMAHPDKIGRGEGEPKIKLKAWHQSTKTNKFEFKLTHTLKVGDNLGEKTNNPSYLNYTISRIHKNLNSGKWSVTFSNGVELIEKQKSGHLENIWALQLEWLIDSHFRKTVRLKRLGIKCLSLIFIDKVANYIGEQPIIKHLFVEKYKTVFARYNSGAIPDDPHIQAVQGYYFAQKSSGEYADTEGGIKEQAKIYELILKGKEELLTLSNPVQFIFSHSALGVGWDNPNVFNIATLNTAYSDIRKRQEIGRGLRICVNQDGQRMYDTTDTDGTSRSNREGDTERINLLTVVPNESYETYITQYQEEIKAVYGKADVGANISHIHKGEVRETMQINGDESNKKAEIDKQLGYSLLKRTDNWTNFDESQMIEKAAKGINEITISEYAIEAATYTIDDFAEGTKEKTAVSKHTTKQKAIFAPLDLIAELSENTGLAYTTLFKIIEKTDNYGEWIKNPPRFIHEAALIIRNIEANGRFKP